MKVRERLHVPGGFDLLQYSVNVKDAREAGEKISLCTCRHSFFPGAANRTCDDGLPMNFVK
jgi:hypothetical protein